MLAIRFVPAVVVIATAVFAQSPMILDAIAQTPNLSIFSSLITGTGGDAASPDLGERFNNPDGCILYTVLAPTNDVSSRIPRLRRCALTDRCRRSQHIRRLL